LSVVTRSVRVQRERTEKARRRWRERVRVSKQEGLCHCLFVCLCVCVCVCLRALLDMESAWGQEPQWSASRPACVSVWRLAKPESEATVTQINTLSHTHSDLTGPIQHGLLCWISRGHWLWPG